MDSKALEEKLSSGKELSAEEKVEIMKDDTEVDGYAKPPVAEAEPVKKDTEPAPDKKPDPKPAAAEPSDPFLKIETELSKEPGKEDLTTFSEREKAYFHQMRRDRKNRQEAEGERDGALFKLSKLEKQLAAQPKVEAPIVPAADDPIELLKKKDPTDFLTVAEVTKIVEKLSAPKPEPKKEEPKPAPKGQDPVQMRYLKMCDDEARSAHPEDYDAVMELTSEILNTNQKHLQAVAQSIEQGENPAIKSYELIKSDPEFAKLFPVAKTKVEARKKAAEKPEPKKEKTPEAVAKEEEAKKAEAALEKNKDKTKTTGHVGTGDDKPTDELSLEEVSKMSDKEFAKLPKKQRQKFLEALREV